MSSHYIFFASLSSFFNRDICYNWIQAHGCHLIAEAQREIFVSASNCSCMHYLSMWFLPVKCNFIVIFFTAGARISPAHVWSCPTTSSSGTEGEYHQKFKALGRWAWVLLPGDGARYGCNRFLTLTMLLATHSLRTTNAIRVRCLNAVANMDVLFSPRKESVLISDICISISVIIYVCTLNWNRNWAPENACYTWRPKCNFQGWPSLLLYLFIIIIIFFFSTR